MRGINEGARADCDQIGAFGAAFRRRCAVVLRTMAGCVAAGKSLWGAVEDRQKSSFPACEAGCSTPRRPSGRPGAQACVKR
jgi:hypothetical protein